jgi:hypothetical protein
VRSRQRVFNRDYREERAGFRNFLGQFVPDGSLAFDVAAHRGLYVETLLELGARVVAVEPDPALAGISCRLRQRPGRRSSGRAEPGQSTLLLGRDDRHSTDSLEWVAAHPQRWTTEITTGLYEFAMGADRLDWTDGATLAMELERLAARNSAISGDVSARHLPQPPV